MDGVYADVLVGVLDGDVFGEEADGALGGVVGGVAEGDDAGDGGDVDDGAAAGLEHGGDGELHAEEDALGVDVHGAVPAVVRAFFEFFTDEDAGVVDEDIEVAEAFYGSVDGIAPAIFAGDVEGDEEGLAAGVVDFVGDGLALLTEDVA